MIPDSAKRYARARMKMRAWLSRNKSSVKELRKHVHVVNVLSPEIQSNASEKRGINESPRVNPMAYGRKRRRRND